MKDVIALNVGSDSEIKCLDHGYVKLIDCMPRFIPDNEETADHAIAEAARCSYQRGTKTIADDKTLIRYLMRHDHTSPFEMIEFKFHCKLPIYCARQMIRHREASVNELSGRYSEMPEEYHIPDELRCQSQTNTQGSEGELDKDTIRALTGMMNLQAMDDFNFYNRLLQAGVAREQARILLPLSTYTEWYWKIDLKNLLHFLDLRCDSHAQKEMQVYANAILELITPIVPWTIEAWEDYSPYRNGMILTSYEAEALNEYLSEVEELKKSSRNTELKISDVEIDNKLEKKEWRDKLKDLGIDDRI